MASKVYISEVLPTTRDAKGKIVTRSGVCTGLVYRGREYGIMAADKDTLKALIETLNGVFVGSRCKRAVWVNAKHYKRLPGRRSASRRDSDA